MSLSPAAAASAAPRASSCPAVSCHAGAVSTMSMPAGASTAATGISGGRASSPAASTSSDSSTDSPSGISTGGAGSWLSASAADGSATASVTDSWAKASAKKSSSAAGGTLCSSGDGATSAAGAGARLAASASKSSAVPAGSPASSPCARAAASATSSALSVLPAEMASAAAINGLVLIRGGWRLLKSSTRPGTTDRHSEIRLTMIWSGGKILSRTLFSMFSKAQASSPTTLAPTMRPDPLRVWKPRRNSSSEAVSSKLAAHFGKYSLMVSITSSASSTKISRISSSKS